MEQSALKASIIVRAYNAEATVGRALESALRQSFPKDEREIIVVDDGSTDRTPAIVGQFEGVRAVTQKNAGAIAAANRGLEEARGEFISYLDADDCLEPDFLFALVQALEADRQAQFAYCDYWEEKSGTRKLISPRSPFEGFLGNFLFRKDALEAEGGFREFLFADYELLLRTLGWWRSVHVEQPLFVYMRHAGSISGNKKNVAQALEDLKRAHPDKIAIIDTIRSYD